MSFSGRSKEFNCLSYLVEKIDGFLHSSVFPGTSAHDKDALHIRLNVELAASTHTILNTKRQSIYKKGIVIHSVLGTFAQW
jgi:hypothetical protein